VSGTGATLFTFGAHPSARFGADEITYDGRGTSYTLVDRDTAARVPVRTTLAGPFNVSNALAAAATATAAGFSLDAVASGLAQPARLPGRMEPVERGQGFAVLVDYAHTPDALANVLGAARAIADGGRVLAVFGAGGDRDRAKRPLMGEAVARAADMAVLTSDNPRSEAPAAIADEVHRGLRSGPAQVTVELDRRAAIRHALAAARPGDVVVIAGKGHETGQTIGDRTLPFDDRVVAGEELEALGWT
jgi:UDP-N-acetylmuramoyl-L-alanyl-D-glutamate--2,6-diaminopimelate ligase